MNRPLSTRPGPGGRLDVPRNPCPGGRKDYPIPSLTTGPTAEIIESALHTLSSTWEWDVRIDPRRTSVTIKVERDASVVVTVPTGLSAVDVATAVASKLAWIARQVRSAQETAPAHPVKQLVGGEGFPWLGRSHRLRLVDDGPIVTLEPGPSGWLRLRREHAGDAQALIAWYSEQFLAHLTAATALWHRRMGLGQDVRLAVADLGEELSSLRLGTTPKVSLHWAAAQLPPSQVSYLLARELVHVQAGRRLAKRAHAQCLDRLMPGWADHHRDLTQRWRHTWTGAVSPRVTASTTSDTGQIFCRFCQHAVASSAALRIGAAESDTNPWCCPDCWDERLA
ncbi:YgjP-like metallopeptidase domain-containing protein [Nonomuraea sp. NPDC049695]|uniref:YgjP-like metallopeptidase domain-containing protein n=1 Tax=Nonomuraea sp. NPDC049695 TaxID=3154734 RepID=UPI00341DFB55